MKILIIDNGTTFLSAIINYCKNEGHDVSVVEWNNALPTNSHWDFIILSGGHGIPVSHHEKEFSNEIDLIRSCEVPLLGICLGFELIAVSFGSTLKMMDERVSEKQFIQVVKDDPIFKDAGAIGVYESHRWKVDRLGKELVELAESNDGIEIFRHKHKPIYGFQFHPEVCASEIGDGAQRLFDNLLKIAQSGKIESTKY